MEFKKFKEEAEKFDHIEAVIENAVFVIVKYVNGWSRFPKNRKDKMKEVLSCAKFYKK